MLFCPAVLNHVNRILFNFWETYDLYSSGCMVLSTLQGTFREWCIFHDGLKLLSSCNGIFVGFVRIVSKNCFEFRIPPFVPTPIGRWSYEFFRQPAQYRIFSKFGNSSWNISWRALISPGIQRKINPRDLWMIPWNYTWFSLYTSLDGK